MADLLRFKHQSEPLLWRSAWGEVERVLEASESAAHDYARAAPLLRLIAEGLGFRGEMVVYAERALEAVAVCYILRGGLTAETGRWLMAPWRQARRTHGPAVPR